MEITRVNGIPIFRTPNGGGEIYLRPGFVISNLLEGTRTFPASLELEADDEQVAIGAQVIDKTGRNFEFSLNGTRNLDTFAGLFGIKMEKGFVNNSAFSLSFEFPYEPGDYLFIPGISYGDAEPAPGKESTSFTFFTAALALPCIGVYCRDKNSAFLFSTGSSSVLGSNLLTFRHHREKSLGEITLTLSAGCRDCDPSRERELRTASYEQGIGEMYLGESGALSLPLCLNLFDCDSMQRFFAAFRHLRILAMKRPLLKNRLPFSYAVGLAESNLNDRHWFNDFYLSCNYLNLSGGEPEPGNDNFPDSWYLRHGAQGGAPLAYAMSLSGDELSRDRGLQMLDFIAQHGLAPSGIFYSLHNRWSGLGDPPWTHLRPAVDCCFYLLKACQQHGAKSHPQWRAAALQCCDTLADIFRNHGEFGYQVARNAQPEIWEKGSAAGGLVIACLVLAHRLFGREEFLTVALEAARWASDILAGGAAGGACMEAGQAPDSASLSALMESFTLLYEETKDKSFLEEALFATDQFSSYVMAKSIPLSPQNPLHSARIETRGSVFLNSKEPLLGPGPGASSLSALLRLYQVTGDEWLLELLSDVIRALPQYLSEYHAQLGELRRGMGASGLLLRHTGPDGVASLSQAAGVLPLLLAWHELPGIYIDPPRSNYIVLDHLNVGVNFEHSRIFLSNPTPYHATGRIAIELGLEEFYDLAPGESAEISF
ncbi:MAG: hypothetical protein JXA52_06640 [Planctomycetes bacterium]|nr:hypothetical protein [Planctomycetota bacterium]